MTNKQYSDLFNKVNIQVMEEAYKNAFNVVSEGYVKHLVSVMRENRISEERITKIVTEATRRVQAEARRAENEGILD